MRFNFRVLCCVKWILLSIFVHATVQTLQRSQKPKPQLNPTPLSPSSRIVGGTSVNIRSYPYQLSYLYRGKHICGATILSEKFAVTAAHCTNSARSNPSAISLRAGSSTLNQGGQLVRVKTVHQHPRFNLIEVDYDISILEVSTKFSFNENVRSVGVVTGEPREGSQVTISGWGTLKEDSDSLPKQLQSTQIPIVGRRRCRQAYVKIGDISDRMICAGLLKQGGKDSCQGDSGGPMTFNGRLAGIVSWGYGCGHPDYPGVYTSIGNTEVRRFIRRIIGI